MKIARIFFGLFVCLSKITSAFEDNDGFYAQNQAYGRKVQKKKGGGLAGLLLGVIAGAAGLAVGEWHDKRQKLAIKKKHQKEVDLVWKRSSLDRQEMVKNKDNDIKQLKQKLREGYAQIEEQETLAYQNGVDLGMGTLEADLAEFREVEASGDDRITKDEFNAYVKAYMKAYPQIPLSEYPTFDDFDTNRNGYITFEEWQQFLFRQRIEEQQSAAAKMYDKSQDHSSFEALYQELLKHQ